MTNKAPPPVVEESATAAAPTADRHPPHQTITSTPSPAVVTYDPLPHEKVCCNVAFHIYSDARALPHKLQMVQLNFNNVFSYACLHSV